MKNVNCDRLKKVILVVAKCTNEIRKNQALRKEKLTMRFVLIFLLIVGSMSFAHGFTRAAKNSDYHKIREAESQIVEYVMSHK